MNVNTLPDRIMQHISGWKWPSSCLVVAARPCIAQDAQLATTPGSNDANQQTRDDMDLEQLTVIPIRSNLVVTPSPSSALRVSFFTAFPATTLSFSTTESAAHHGFESESRRVPCRRGPDDPGRRTISEGVVELNRSCRLAAGSASEAA